jgi:hypothetical protein
MKKFIKDVININKEDKDNKKNNIDVKELLGQKKAYEDMLNITKDEETKKMLKEKIKEIDELIDNNINIAKEYMKELEGEKTTSLPYKLDKNTKLKFKNIVDELKDVKQGELVGALIKYFVETYCKENPDSNACKDNNTNND